MRFAKIFCVALVILIYTGSVSMAQSSSTLTELKESLQSLKKANKLTDWLYLRIDYSYDHPKQSLDFLMDSEKQMWRLPETSEEKEALMLLFSNQAYNQLFSGNILESIDRYEKAYSYYTEHKLNVSGVADYIFKPWANNYTRLGDYEKALYIQKQTLAYAIKEKDSALIAGSYNNIGISLRSLGNLKEAEHSVKLGLTFLPPTSPSKALLQNTLADIYKESGRIYLASVTISKNIAFQTDRKLTFESAYWLLSSYITAGDVQLLETNYKGALSFYQQALMINRQYYDAERLREQAYITTQIGVLKLKSGLPSEALKYYNQTLKILGINYQKEISDKALFGDNRLVDVFYQLSLVYRQLNNPEQALKNLQLSLSVADMIRFELGDVKTKQRFQADTKRKAELAIDLAFELLQKTNQAKYAEIILSIFEQTKSRTLLDDIRKNNQQLVVQAKDSLFTAKQKLQSAIAYYQKEILQNPKNDVAVNTKIEALKFKLASVEKKLQEKYPTLINESNNTNIDVGKLLFRLPENSHLVSYFFGKENLYVLEIKNKRIKQVRKIIQANAFKTQLKEFVNTYFQNGPDAMMNSPKQFFKTSNNIYNTLIGGLDLKQGTALTIIPDEAVGYISFDGLITNDNYNSSISKWPFLINKFNVSYGFSLQTLINQSQVKKKPSGDFTGFFITHENEGRNYLPAVAKEANAIEKRIQGKFLIDAEASIQNFNTAYESSSVLHISTHAYLSGIQQEPTLSLNDGSVFLFELFASRSSPLLVVLSACRTADGLMAEGEGIMSLSRGFTAIGTQGTIAGLWNVNDEAAARITDNCYEGLLKGRKISVALHLAKLKWLSEHKNVEQDYLPYYWDSLI
ncbi:MAG: CHAT domain-containing protein [Pedobacter sp.]|nr:MAG: CHAT domain-containing protein [Pedobacter sp.]